MRSVTARSTHELIPFATDKPHSAIAAEYLAHGYLLSDTAIEKAIAADKRSSSLSLLLPR